MYTRWNSFTLNKIMQNNQILCNAKLAKDAENKTGIHSSPKKSLRFSAFSTISAVQNQDDNIK